MAIGSHEARTVDEDEATAYEQYVNTIVRDKQIIAQYFVAHDEFREFRTRNTKRVRVSAKELRASVSRWVAETTGSRISHTVGLYLCPILGIARAYVIFNTNTVSLKELKRIQETFPDLDFTRNPKGGVSGSVHANFLLGQVLPKAAKKMREFWRKDNSALLSEDLCPCHSGDKDGGTQETGLKLKRVALLKAMDMWRALTPRKGNPRCGVNDQVHKIIHTDIQAEIFETIGLSKSAQKRPRGATLKPGGRYLTAAGSRKGAAAFQFAQAVHKVVQN